WSRGGGCMVGAEPIVDYRSRGAWLRPGAVRSTMQATPWRAGRPANPRDKTFACHGAVQAPGRRGSGTHAPPCSPSYVGATEITPTDPCAGCTRIPDRSLPGRRTVRPVRLWTRRTLSRYAEPMERESTADVAIVGADLAGLVAGAILTRHGRRVVVLE